MAMPASDMMFDGDVEASRIKMNDTSTGQRQRHADHERAAEVHQDQQDRQRGDDHLVREHLGDRVDRPVDQPRAVVERHDPHALGQARLQLVDLLLDPLGDLQRVLAVPHHHHAADRLVAVLFQHAAAELRAEARPWPGCRS